MSRRQWKSWPRRSIKALTETSGFIGLAGVAVSAAAATLKAPLLLASGGIAISAALLYAIYRGIPPKMTSAADKVGFKFSISELGAIYPSVLKLGIAGYTQSGKTTFLNHALQQASESTRTNRTYATILALQTSPTIYIALLDGDGTQFTHQFEVADNADFIIVFLDHNSGESDPSKSSDRMAEHENFLRQLVSKLSMRNRIKQIHLLLNKRDLWEFTQDADDLKIWLDTLKKQIQSANIALNVTADAHSNLQTTDLGKVLRLISEAAAEQ